MFEVLVYLYENYWRPDACPEPEQLARKLTAVGFESEEIRDALNWLGGLSEAEPPEPLGPTERAMRIYSEVEQEVLDEASIGFIRFLESAGVLPPALREMVVDRALAAGVSPLPLEDLKVIVLMVFWRLGEEPDALILDELFVDPQDRLIH